MEKECDFGATTSEGDLDCNDLLELDDSTEFAKNKSPSGQWTGTVADFVDDTLREMFTRFDSIGSPSSTSPRHSQIEARSGTEEKSDLSYQQISKTFVLHPSIPSSSPVVSSKTDWARSSPCCSSSSYYSYPYLSPSHSSLHSSSSSSCGMPSVVVIPIDDPVACFSESTGTGDGGRVNSSEGNRLRGVSIFPVERVNELDSSNHDVGFCHTVSHLAQSHLGPPDPIKNTIPLKVDQVSKVIDDQQKNSNSWLPVFVLHQSDVPSSLPSEKQSSPKNISLSRKSPDELSDDVFDPLFTFDLSPSTWGDSSELENSDLGLITDLAVPLLQGSGSSNSCYLQSSNQQQLQQQQQQQCPLTHQEPEENSILSDWNDEQVVELCLSADHCQTVSARSDNKEDWEKKSVTVTISIPGDPDIVFPLFPLENEATATKSLFPDSDVLVCLGSNQSLVKASLDFLWRSKFSSVIDEMNCLKEASIRKPTGLKLFDDNVNSAKWLAYVQRFQPFISRHGLVEPVLPPDAKRCQHMFSKNPQRKSPFGSRKVVQSPSSSDSMSCFLRLSKQLMTIWEKDFDNFVMQLKKNTRDIVDFRRHAEHRQKTTNSVRLVLSRFEMLL